MRRAIASFLHLFTLLTFSSAAAFFFSLPFLPVVRLRLAHILMDEFRLSFWIGGGFSLATILLLVGFYGLNRGRTLRIRMGDNLTSVEIPVIRETIEDYLKRAMPNQISLVDVEVLGQKKLQIGVVMPNREEALLHQVEQELQVLLKERFGYLKPFDLVVHSIEPVVKLFGA